MHLLTLLCHRVDKKMVKKARQQEKQGTAPNNQTFQVKLVKVLPGWWPGTFWMSNKPNFQECKYFAVFLKPNNPGAQKC